MTTRPVSERPIGAGTTTIALPRAGPPALLDEPTKRAGYVPEAEGMSRCREEVTAPLDKLTGQTLLGSHGLREHLTRGPTPGKNTPSATPTLPKAAWPPLPYILVATTNIW